MIVDKAIWMMERNADQALSLAAVAEGCGVSRSHLANAFGSATGGSVIRYLRGRRLSEAAKALAGGAPDILGVALDAGYGSHEAFTRAFRDQFGVTPERVRETGAGDLTLVAPIDFTATAGQRLQPPAMERAEPIKAVGLTRSVSFDSIAEIPAHWRRFVEQVDEVSECLGRMPIGVCYPADEDGRFDYVAALEVAGFDDVPKGMSRVELPARTCAVFKHEGHVSTIFQTYAAIWNDALPASGLSLAEGPVIERHNPAFDPDTGEGGLLLWVPVHA